MLSKLKSVYKRVSDSTKWQDSSGLRFVRPTANLSIKTVRTALHIARNFTVKDLIGKRMHKALAVRFNKTVINTQLARQKLRKQQWSKALKYYIRVLELERRHGPLHMSELRNEAKLNVSVLNRLLNIGNYQTAILQYKKDIGKHLPRIAIYTAISGNYDTLKFPAKPDPVFDYIVYSDSPLSGAGIFQVRPMPYYHEDPTRMARYVKTHPHILLSEYDVVIWIDANIMITGDLSSMLAKFLMAKELVGAVPHPLRKSALREAYACIRQGKDDVDQIKLQVKHLKELGYDNNDLIESNVIMFKLGSAKIEKFFNTWWRELDNYSRRDQLSLNLSLDQSKLKWHRLMAPGINARTHPELCLVNHQVKQISLQELQNKLGAKSVDPFKDRSYSQVQRERIAAQAQCKIDIVYCVHNALDDVKICLKSVVRHRKNKHVKLIIVDDGSDQPTADFLASFATDKTWVKLIRNEEAHGYTRAANVGLRASTGELVILLNSDTIVTDSWTEKMADSVFTTPGAGIVGPLSSAAGQQSIPNTESTGSQTATNVVPTGLSIEELNRNLEQWSMANFVPRVPLIHGFCMGITREVIEKIGYFDEKNFPFGYGEENDYCFRATDAGFGLVLATNTYIYHAKSKSYPDARRIKLMKKGNETFRQLYGEKRIRRGILTVKGNPLLISIRKKTAALYRKHGVVI